MKDKFNKTQPGKKKNGRIKSIKLDKQKKAPLTAFQSFVEEASLREQNDPATVTRPEHLFQTILQSFRLLVGLTWNAQVLFNENETRLR